MRKREKRVCSSFWHSNRLVNGQLSGILRDVRNGFLSIAVTTAAVFAYFVPGGLQSAYAYRAARIGADQAELKDGPSPDANPDHRNNY